MNERIKELMARAGFDPTAIERMGVMPHAEKFAELIIRECAEVADDYTFDCEGMSFGLEEVLVKHFGVK